MPDPSLHPFTKDASGFIWDDTGVPVRTFSVLFKNGLSDQVDILEDDEIDYSHGWIEIRIGPMKDSPGLFKEVLSFARDAIASCRIKRGTVKKLVAAPVGKIS